MFELDKKKTIIDNIGWNCILKKFKGKKKH